MESFEIILNLTSFIFVLGLWLFIVVRGYRSWFKLKAEFVAAEIIWPYPSQNEINHTFRKSPVRGYSLMFKGVLEVIKLLFFRKFNNPEIIKHITSIRRSLMLFVTLPFMYILIITTIFVLYVL